MDEITKRLNEFLSDLNVFYRKLQNYHWNVKGMDFFMMHEKLEEYYNEINEQIDEIAEHILMLGEQPLGTMRDYLENSKLEEAENKKIQDSEVFKKLKIDLEVLLKVVTNIKKLADEKNLYITSCLMDNYITDYSKKLWMIGQTLM